MTWLYGPLHGEAKPVPPPKVASTAERLGIEDTTGKKSILKHRTLSELLQQPKNVSTPDEDDSGDDTWSRRSELHTIRSEMQLARTADLRRRTGSPEIGLSGNTQTAQEPDRAKRHISFNSKVEQCVALEFPGSPDSYDYEEDDEDEYDSEEDDESDEYSDEGNDVPQPQPRMRRSSSSSSEPRASIARLAPTQLKTPHEYIASSPVTHTSGFTDSDEDSYDDEDARYSMADPVPVTQDLPIDQDGFDYYASDEEYDNSSASFAQSVSNTAGNGPWFPTHADQLASQFSLDSRTYDPADSSIPETRDPASMYPSMDRTRGRSLPSGAQRDATSDTDDMIPPHSSETSATPSPQERLIVDVDNLPSLNLDDDSGSHVADGLTENEDPRAASLGPTPQNTPNGQIPGYSRSRRAPTADGSARASGALVAPPANLPQVPLSEDYVEEHEGGLIAGAVEILNTARDLLGTLIGTSGEQGRFWYQ